MNRTNMGPKTYPDSSINTGESLLRKRKGDREEFSDNEPEYEYDQDYPDDKDQEEEVPPNSSIQAKVSDKRSTYKRQETGNYRSNRPQLLKGDAVTVDHIDGPKRKIAPQPRTDSIFTKTFICQFVIIITGSFVVSSMTVYILNGNVSYNKTESCNETHIKDINREVQIAIDTKLNKADIHSKIQDELDSKLAGIDIYDTVNVTLMNQIPRLVHEIANGDKVKRIIETEMSQKCSEVRTETVECKKRLEENKEIIDKAGNDIKDLNSSISDVKSKQTNTTSDIKMLFESVNETNSTVDKMSREYPELLNTSKENSAEIVKLQKSIDEGKKQLEEMNNEFQELKKNLSGIEALYAKHKKEVEELEGIRSKLAVMQPNMFNKESLIMAFMILIVIVFVLAASVYNLYQRPVNAVAGWTDARTPTRQRSNLGNRDILKQIPNRVDLTDGVCIISFDEARVERHRQIFDSANIPDCKVQAHVVRRHEQILELPRCKVYLMCTEFSERHVIIEEPGKGLGDLHRTTYDAVMKLGGCLIILYTRDPGSRILKDNVRYNERIYCVSNQPELAKLNQDGRFFSTYDQLNNYQKTELRRNVIDSMK